MLPRKLLSVDSQAKINLRIFVLTIVATYVLALIELIAATGVFAPFTFNVFYLVLVFLLLTSTYQFCRAVLEGLIDGKQE